jgi:hypothetical protein
MESMKTGKPDWVRDSRRGEELFLDLGRYLRHGMEPLPEIMRMLEEARPCQCLHLVSPKEPVTLYAVLEPMGFEHYSEKQGKVWNVYFRKCGCP